MLVNLSKNVYFKWNRNGQFVDLVIWQFFVLRGVLSFLLFNVNMAERVINCQRVELSKKNCIFYVKSQCSVSMQTVGRDRGA